MSSVVQFVVGGGLLGIAALAGAYVSLRGVRNNNAKVVAQTRSIVASDQDKLLARYATIVEAQDHQLESCRARIDDLEAREDECEKRAAATERKARDAEDRANRAVERAVELAGRVKHLEEVLHRAGLNGG